MSKLIFLVLLLASSLSFAETGSRTCRVLYLAAPDDAPKKLQLFDGKRSIEVELPSMNLSPVYQLAGGDISICLSPESYALPEEVDPLAPSTKLAAGVKDFYLLVSNDPNNKVAPVKLQVVPLDDSKFKRGEMLWFNLTANEVGGTVGREKLAMKAKSRTVLKEPTDENGDFNVNLVYRIPGKKHLYPLCETKWLHDPRSRTIVFVMNVAGSRTPRVVGFPDFRMEKRDE